MPFLLITAAAGFACMNPTHHDGDAIRCAGEAKSMRLHGIDAPEMPGACRPGRACTPGDPYAARDALRALTRNRKVTCEQVDTDHYGRRVVACTAGGEDLGCAMIAAGHAVERYGSLDCAPARIASALGDARDLASAAIAGVTGTSAQAERRLDPSDAEPVALFWPVLGVWLFALNLLTYIAFAVDKRRATIGLWNSRIPERSLLTLAALGGSAGAVLAQQRLRHKTRKQPFATYLLLIIGLHIGIAVGVATLL